MCPLNREVPPISLKSKSTSQSVFVLTKLRGTQRSAYWKPSFPWPLKHGCGPAFCRDRLPGLTRVSLPSSYLLPSCWLPFSPLWQRVHSASPSTGAVVPPASLPQGPAWPKLSSWGGGTQAAFLPAAHRHNFVIGIQHAIFPCWSIGKLKIILSRGYYFILAFSIFIAK